MIAVTAVIYGPKLAQFNKFYTKFIGGGKWTDTLSFLARGAVLYVEQYMRQTVRYDASKKVFILSFFLKGRLHQIYVRPPKGPQIGAETPLERGYASIVELKHTDVSSRSSGVGTMSVSTGPSISD